MTRASRLLVCGLGCVSAASVFAGYHSARAADTHPVVITVTAGAPRELAFKLSRSSILPWTAKERLTFEVTNKGMLRHDFEVCAAPVEQATANTCHGEMTRSLGSGQSTTLTVTFRQRGIYEYLSTIPGEAAHGMKGLIGVGVKLATTSAPTLSIPVTTSTPATTTTASAPSSLVGDANDGKPLFTSAGCASCHTLTSAGIDGAVNASLNMTKPSQSEIVQYVTNGSSTPGSSMPSYAGTLTQAQINDLAAYIYLVTHTIN